MMEMADVHNGPTVNWLRVFRSICVDQIKADPDPDPARDHVRRQQAKFHTGRMMNLSSPSEDHITEQVWRMRYGKTGREAMDSFFEHIVELRPIKGDCHRDESVPPTGAPLRYRKRGRVTEVAAKVAHLDMEEEDDPLSTSEIPIKVQRLEGDGDLSVATANSDDNGVRIEEEDAFKILVADNEDDVTVNDLLEVKLEGAPSLEGEAGRNPG